MPWRVARGPRAEERLAIDPSLAQLRARGQAGEDPAVIQAETAALYAAHGTSPARIFLPDSLHHTLLYLF